MNMETFKFKTNINCGGCLARISPILNNKFGIEKWNVDITNPDKVLTVETYSLTTSDIMEEVKKVGFSIEKIL